MSERSKQESLEGVVRSSKAEKTITVVVPTLVQHPKYRKFIRRSSVFHVHDERNEAKEGDRVQITECRPVSKSKHWRLTKIVERAQTA
jgi:small subunit ribosomal protein S17